MELLQIMCHLTVMNYNKTYHESSSILIKQITTLLCYKQVTTSLSSFSVLYERQKQLYCLVSHVMSYNK